MRDNRHRLPDHSKIAIKSAMRCCPSCSFDIGPAAVCPKCDENVIRAKACKPLVVDLAHRGETVSQALAKLDAAVSECMWHGHLSLKVIHGHCSGSGVSRIKLHVLSALRKHAERIGGVVEQDGDNPGAHVLWFK